jgi:hypothetical protein
LWVNRWLLYNLLWYQNMLTLNETRCLPASNGSFSSFRIWRVVLVFENPVSWTITRELDVSYFFTVNITCGQDISDFRRFVLDFRHFKYKSCTREYDPWTGCLRFSLHQIWPFCFFVAHFCGYLISLSLEMYPVLWRISSLCVYFIFPWLLAFCVDIVDFPHCWCAP